MNTFAHVRVEGFVVGTACTNQIPLNKITEKTEKNRMHNHCQTEQSRNELGSSHPGLVFSQSPFLILTLCHCCACYIDDIPLK